MITNIGVINSQEARTGVWSFPQFMRFLAGPSRDASVFTENWLMNWATDTLVNGKISPGRPKVLEIVRSWPRRPDGHMDLQKAPFILNAIVNRIDLTALKAFNQTAQLRFVFEALDPRGKPTHMMINFEFSVPYSHDNPAGQTAWAKLWHRLYSLPFGRGYNALLAKITSRVFQLSSLNDLSLFHLRTCDGIFSSPPEMRSFCINSKRTGLEPCENNHSPALEYASNKQPQLVQWIQSNIDNVLNDVYSIPEEFKATHYPIGNFKWAQVLENSPDPKLRLARQKFAINACNGCHSQMETGSLVMIGNRELNTEPKVAPFVKLDLVTRQKIYQTLLGK